MDQVEKTETPVEEEVPVGPVQAVKDVIADKEATAHENTPEGMEFVGWLLDGWVAPYPLISANARPVYAYPHEEVEVSY